MPALTYDDRPDIDVLNAISTLLRDLLVNATVTDTAAIDTLHVSIAEHRWLDPGVNHWAGDRVAASHVAWAKLTRQLRDAQSHLGEPSWYHAAAVLDDIVDLYRTTRSARAFRREADDKAVRDIIAPMIEGGFAAQAALLRHLSDHAAHLQDLAAAGTATEQQLEDLPVAVELAEVVAEQARRGDADPKQPAGDDRASSSSGTPAERVAQATSTRAELARFTTGSLAADAVLETVRVGLSASVDYSNPDVAAAADLVTMLLVSFIYDREATSSAARPYLFDQNASEGDLADDLVNFLAGCGRLGGVRTEVRHVGGGRVDIEFAFPGFNVYVELKADSTAVPLGDKGAYLRQTAAYQTTDVRIGFLFVLKILKPKTVASHLTDNADVIEFVDACGGKRHVVAFALSGGRTTPSGM